MSREIREKPRGKGGTIKRGRNMALELARRRAAQAAIYARDQARIEQDGQQPESFGDEQIEGGAQRGAALAEHGIERTAELSARGVKKLTHTGKEHRAPQKESRPEPEERHRNEPRGPEEAPNVKERATEPESRIREKPAQSERVSAKNARPVKERDRRAEIPRQENARPNPQGPQTKAPALKTRNTVAETPELPTEQRAETTLTPSQPRLKEQQIKERAAADFVKQPVSADDTGKLRFTSAENGLGKNPKTHALSAETDEARRKPVRGSDALTAEREHVVSDAAPLRVSSEGVSGGSGDATAAKNIPRGALQSLSRFEGEPIVEQHASLWADAPRVDDLPPVRDLRLAPDSGKASHSAGARHVEQPEKSLKAIDSPEAAKVASLTESRAATPAAETVRNAQTAMPRGGVSHSADRPPRPQAMPHKGGAAENRMVVKERRAHAGGKVKTRAPEAAERAKGMAIRSTKESREAAKAAGKGIQGTKRAAKDGAKAAAKSLKETIRAAAESLRAMLTALASGGGVVFLVVLVICLVAMVLATPFGLFFSADSHGSGGSVQSAVTSINGEFCMVIEQIQEEHPCDVLVLDNDTVTAVINNWDDVLAIYAVLVTTDGASPTEAVTMTQEKLDVLRSVFWDMTQISYTIETTEETDDGESTRTLTINITIKNKDQIAAEYGFTAEQLELLAEMTQLEYASLFAVIKGSDACLKLSPQQVAEIEKQLPEGLSEERRKVVLTAYRLLGRVNYFWGGKSLCLGWDTRWGAPYTVTAEGDSTSGTIRPYGLDCSGFVDWVFYNVSDGAYVIGHGGGASAQHSYCTAISWAEARPGDLAFYPGDSHVGIICGFDEDGNVRIIHCAKSADNVVITGKSGFTTVGRPNYYTE